MTSQDPSPSTSVVDARFVAHGARTEIDRLFESGALRLRRPRGPACEAMIVNTGGGIVGGDRLTLGFSLAGKASVTATSVAAEKIYRSAGPEATIDTRLAVGPGARLDWLPQETILFDGARLRRRFTIDLAADATLLAAEIIVFGRLASAETLTRGSLRDSWRLCRAGRLVFADETLIEGAIGTTLDRPALAGGARAAALLVLAAPDAEVVLDPLRASLAPFLEDSPERRVEAGASTRDGILVARALSRSPERLRAAMVAAIGAVREEPLPRVWL